MLQKCAIFTGKKFPLTASPHNSGSPVYQIADLSGMTFLLLIVLVLIPSIELRKTKSNLPTGPYVFVLQPPRGPLLVYHSMLYILMW